MLTLLKNRQTGFNTIECLVLENPLYFKYYDLYIDTNAHYHNYTQSYPSERETSVVHGIKDIQISATVLPKSRLFLREVYDSMLINIAISNVGYKNTLTSGGYYKLPKTKTGGKDVSVGYMYGYFINIQDNTIIAKIIEDKNNLVLLVDIDNSIFKSIDFNTLYKVLMWHKYSKVLEGSFVKTQAIEVITCEDYLEKVLKIDFSCVLWITDYMNNISYCEK